MTDSPRLDLPPGVAERVPGDLCSRLVALRHDLHRHPELGFEETWTQRRLRAALLDLGVAEVREVAGTGLVARIPGPDLGVASVVVRGDIDGLPIAEATGVAFASEVPGRMHACGHDVHASWAVGAAALLAAEPAAGDVLVVLQPAEEIARGAAAVWESGALAGAGAVFGGHVDLRFEVGQAVAQAGPLAASADTFRIGLRGGGAHGARPHEGRDPVVGGAAVVSALQTIVSRRLPPGTPAVVTVGSFHAGTAPNVIPDIAELRGTLRALDPEVRRTLRREVEGIARAVALGHGLEAEVELLEGAPPLVNPEGGAAWARQAAARVLGEEALRPLGITNMAGEDFAVYLQHLPGCFLRIGARRPGDPVIPAHSPRFLPADEAVPTGAAVLAECAREASADLA
ncbi:MAG TPA: M20 family metallopeptidase [Thermoanaerobaculia bacterium]|nr:M20 family metallopeptidase [Thermoanaerobaculia bacterium]